MKGKVVLITGATDGIGREAAKELAMQGAKVVVVGRNRSRAEETVKQLDAHSHDHGADYLLADLAKISEVKRLAGEFLSKYSRLDVLINNAGAGFLKRTVTDEGIESTFALNHLAYFTLTNLLLDRIKAFFPSRIINVSSGAHLSGRISFDDIGLERRYFVLKAYRQSKLANVMFTYELARRLQGSGVTVNCLHPGLVKTGIFKKVWVVGPLVDAYIRRRAISVAQGAETIIYLASSPEVEGVTGKYFYKCKARDSSPLSYDLEGQKRLWDLSASMAGLDNQGE